MRDETGGWVLTPAGVFPSRPWSLRTVALLIKSVLIAFKGQGWLSRILCD